MIREAEKTDKGQLFELYRMLVPTDANHFLLASETA